MHQNPQVLANRVTNWHHLSCGSLLAAEREQQPVMFEPTGYIDRQPRFLVTGARLYWSDGSPAYLRQSPFQWVNGRWEAVVQMTTPPNDPTGSVEAVLRLPPDVLDGWKSHSFEPIFETCQQIQEAIRRGVVGTVGCVELSA